LAFERHELALASLLAIVGCAVAREGPELPPPAIGGGAEPGDAGEASNLGGTGGSGGSSGNGGASGSNASGGSGGGSSAAGGSSGTSTAGGSSGSGSGSGGSAGKGGASGSSSAGTSSAGTDTAGTSSAGTSSAGGSSGASGSGGSGTAGSATAGTSSAGTSSAGTGGSGMSGEVLFSEDFESGFDGWESSTGSDDPWSVVMDDTNVLEQAPPQVNSDRFLSAGSGDWTDVSVEARVKVTAFNGSSSSYFAGVYARVQSATNYYSFALRSDGKVSLRKGGSNLGSSEDAGIVEGTYYDVRFVVRGSTLTGYIDGQQIVTTTDSSIQDGAIGVGSRNTSAMFDDVRVTVP
jgi:hypothetical protein